MIINTDDQDKSLLDDTIFDQTVERESNQTSSFDNSELPVQRIQLKKQIAKLKASKSKQFVKRQLYVVPIVYQSLEIYQQCIIFGFIQLESLYRDYKSQSQINLQNIGANALIKISSIENKINDKKWVVNYQILGQSGIKDFNFLINHYKQFPDQYYKELADHLEMYQTYTNQLTNYMSDISLKINSRIIDETEVQKTYQDFDIYFENYIKTNYSEGDFITTSKVMIDYQNQDFLFKDATIPYSTLSLLGIEPQYAELMFQKYIQTYNQLIGVERLKNIIRKLQYSLLDQTKFVYYQEFSTVDSILFNTKCVFEIVYFPYAPKWMDKQSCFGIINKIDISLNQLKSIIELRLSQTNKDLDFNSFEQENSFEYQVQKEIFLQKFYPDLFQDPQSLKSITVKQCLLQ